MCFCLDPFFPGIFAHFWSDREPDLPNCWAVGIGMLILAAGQPSLAKTLLHLGPAQCTCSQGLMANGLIACLLHVFCWSCRGS